MERYQDQSLSFEERARDLVSHMTLEEKISQTVHTAAAINRLGVPAYNWWNEALHGVARAGVATMFPQAIGMAATFDPAMLKQTAEIITHEGRAKYNTNAKHNDRDIYKGLTFWSPNVNIFRDPRWGRGHETYGEDPYLSGLLGVAFIKGIQGDHPKYLKGAACAKHFAVHSGPESVRHEFNATVSQKELRETYLPAFKACVEEGNVEIVMGAYNRTNDEPCCGSQELLVKILRGEWNFKGHVTSDCWAIKDFHEFHKVTSTAPESIALAINNGCDLNCGNMYLNLMIAYNEGLVTEETISESVYRLMLTRMKLGLFDSVEDVPFNKITYWENDTPENNRYALEVSKKSLVLLKNDGTLPLAKEKIKTIAVIGPNADSRAALEGNYFGTASQYITVLDGIREAVSPETRILYAQGCHLHKDRDSGLSQFAGDRMAEAIEAASLADVTVICLGLDANLEGEEGDTGNAFDSGDKRDLRFPGLQNELLRKICETKKPVIVINLTGSAMDLRYADEQAKAIVQAWYPGAQGGRAIASLLFGDYSPSGRLPVTFYRTSEELPDFCDYSMKNRTYRFMQNEAMYPFGFGLSYTQFAYENVKAEQRDDCVAVKVTVKNIGETEATEVTQLYLSHENNPLDVPNWSLRGVSVNLLQAGEEKEIEIILDQTAFILFDEDGKEVMHKEGITLYVGGSQPDKRSVALMKSAPLSVKI